MLKFEKSTSDQQINLIIRDKEFILSRSFFIALALAVGFHGAFFILFQISPFKLRLSTSIFPPVQVEANVFFQDALVASDLDQRPLIDSGLPPPQFSVPSLPEHPPVATEKPMGELMKKGLHENPFNSLEKDIYQPGRTLLAKVQRPPLDLVMSGKIKEQELLSNGLEGKRLPFHHGEARVVYAVLVEGKTGRIVWYEPKQLANVRAWDRLMENVLQDIRFAPNREVFVVDGEIELHLNGEA